MKSIKEACQEVLDATAPDLIDSVPGTMDCIELMTAATEAYPISAHMTAYALMFGSTVYSLQTGTDRPAVEQMGVMMSFEDYLALFEATARVAYREAGELHKIEGGGH